MPAINVRRLRAPDRAEWLRLRAALWPEAALEELALGVGEFLLGGGLLRAVLVAEGASGLCGFLELSVRPYAEGCAGPTPFMEGWFVDDTARRQGVGAALVRAAEGWATEQGFSELASDTQLWNTVSQSAHEALGFEEAERLVSYRKVLLRGA